MLWSASVITSSSSDTEPTIVINFDSGKYIFNAGENTGRAWLQGKSRWTKAKALFLTQLGTLRSSGVPGLTMFLADSGIKSLDVVGPEGLFHFFASMRSYLWRDSIDVKLTESQNVAQVPGSSNPTPLYKDSNIEVFSIPIFSGPSPLSGDAVGCGVTAGKRKRSPSVELPLKRHNRGKSPTGSLASLDAVASSEDFSPSLLFGLHADEWRTWVVQNMFPASALPTPNPSRPSAAAPRPAFRSGSHQQALLHRDRRLPKFQLESLDKAHLPSLCYVVVGPAIRGKFDGKKAKDLGVPFGPIRGQLIAGNPITFPDKDGNKVTILPEDIIGPSDPSQVLFILDVPSVAHIPSLVSAFESSPFYSKMLSEGGADEPDHKVHAVFHLCGEGVLESETYKEFMNRFPRTAHHIVSSRQYLPDPITFTSAAANQVALNQLDSEVFPVPHGRAGALKDISSVPGLPPHVALLRAGLCLDVRPPRGPVMKQTSDNDPMAATPESIFIPDGARKAFEVAKETIAKLETGTEKPGDDVVVVPLGTSSASPTKYRNVSSTLIQIPKYGNILLDCGEGTWGQLSRLFGNDPSRSEGVWRFLRELKCIFLSHMHGDHHIGVAKLLAMRQHMHPPPSEPLYLIGLRALFLYLHELSEIEDLGLGDNREHGVIPILSDHLNWRPNFNPYGKNSLKDGEKWMQKNRFSSLAIAEDLCSTLGLRRFTTVDVDHRARCYGVVLDHKDGWRIVFSGDTKPTLNLVNAGRNATLLIHEATMGDDQEVLAAEKAHSTIAQAINIGTQMSASNIMLTHFSARYPKMPPSLADDGSRSKVVLAFDHARVKIGDLRKLRIYIPALEEFFKDGVAGDDNPPTVEVHEPSQV